jgi:hypothetical protein
LVVLRFVEQKRTEDNTGKATAGNIILARMILAMMRLAIIMAKLLLESDAYLLCVITSR